MHPEEQEKLLRNKQEVTEKKQKRTRTSELWNHNQLQQNQRQMMKEPKEYLWRLRDSARGEGNAENIK